VAPFEKLAALLPLLGLSHKTKSASASLRREKTRRPHRIKNAAAPRDPDFQKRRNLRSYDLGFSMSRSDQYLAQEILGSIDILEEKIKGLLNI